MSPGCMRAFRFRSAWSSAVSLVEPGSYPAPRELLPSQQLPAGKWKGMEIQSLPRARRKEHKGGKGREQMPSLSPHSSSPACCDEPPRHMLHSCSQGSSRGKPTLLQIPSILAFPEDGGWSQTDVNRPGWQNRTLPLVKKD